MRHRIRGALWALVSSVASVAVVAQPATAATIIVTSDSGGIGGPGCTLRDAMTAANTDTATGGCPAGNGADTITLPIGATITLTEADNYAAFYNGLPSVNSEVTVNGNGSSVHTTASGRIFNVQDIGHLTLNDLTVSGGDTVEYSGGGIRNVGTLMLNNCTVNGNHGGHNNDAHICTCFGGGILKKWRDL